MWVRFPPGTICESRECWITRVHALALPSIDSLTPKSSVAAATFIYVARLPSAQFPPGTITRKTKAGNQKSELNQNAIHVSCGDFLLAAFGLGRCGLLIR